MKVAELLEARRRNWQELEQLCMQMERPTRRRLFFVSRWVRLLDFVLQTVTADRRHTMSAATLARFAALYRAACADLALADSYQLPENTVQYLHRLVGRAHNQLYRSQRFNVHKWAEVLLEDVPQRVFNDRCVQAVFVLFWGVFILSAVFAASKAVWPQYAEAMIGDATIEMLEENFKDPITGRDPRLNFQMAGFYIWNNTGIGLKCFAGGLLVIPGLFIMLFNAAHLGACFGYMARPDVPEGANFFHFVTAHGPFELTAIVLSAGAGLRLGLAWVATGGLTRAESLRRTGEYAMPLMGSAMVMFFLAALIEGFLSPS
ncbi:MAG: stage II sporulation protein M, partial [Planctomycetes bacterium]|nr:stage II sporulation protein M [Planctomycetota bacterium]